MSASFDTLLRLAALTRSASEDDLAELDRALDELDVGDRRLLFLAWRLLQGEAAEVNANTPERHAALRAFAEHVGATLEEVENARPGARLFIFRPPAAQ
jgi:hypothetical protein